MSRRPRRACRKGKDPPKPNASMYVGYVEDFETPDMIMRKFQELERLRREQKALMAASQTPKVIPKGEITSSDEEDDDDTRAKKGTPELSEEQLTSLFTQTSSFSVSSVLRNNAVMWEKPLVRDGFVYGFEHGFGDPSEDRGYTEEDFMDELKMAADFEMDDFENDIFGDFSDASDDESKRSRKGKRKLDGVPQSKTARRRPKRVPSGSQLATARFKSYISGRDAGKSGGGGPIPRIARVCSDISYTRIPALPMPPTWCHMVSSIAQRDALKKRSLTASHYLESDLTQLSAEQLPEKTYEAILIDFPFQLTLEESWGSLSMDDFRKLPVADIRSEGMLFVWTPSELIMEVTEACESWSYRFAEHATWVRKRPNNAFHTQQSQVLAVCKCNLLLFRKLKPKRSDYYRMELRHQRTSDVLFGYSRRHPETGRDLKAFEYTYELIEVMLPNTGKVADKNSCATRLYLGAPKNERRYGWTNVWDSETHGRKIIKAPF